MHDTMRAHWEDVCTMLLEIPYVTIVTAMGGWPRSSNTQRGNNMEAQKHIASHMGLGVYDISQQISDLDASDFHDSTGHLKISPERMEFTIGFSRTVAFERRFFLKLTLRELWMS